MCGIVGYVGARQAYPILIEGLKKLEYRGYDSAGIALLSGDSLKLMKAVGRLCNLEERVGQNGLSGNTGIGHTRWATHGRPSDTNAHPHSDCTGDIVIIHNGIIENYQPIRQWLLEKGHNFSSETDTEVVAHLVEHFYDGDLKEAVRLAMGKISGSYALVVMSRREPGRLICARKDSPLVIGLGEGENFIASDIPALLKHTRRTFILEDGELAEVTASSVSIENEQGQKMQKDVFFVEWNPEAAEKEGYDHFMLKEIFEQSRAIRNTLRGRLTPDGLVQLDEIKLTAEQAKSLKKVVICACGTSYHAGLVGKYVMEKLLRLPVEVDIASEFRYRDPLVDENTLVVVISQSGETADTLAAMRLAKEKGCPVVAITNVVGSTISREADQVIYTWAGPEIAVASTKAYMTQLVVLYLLALHLGSLREILPDEQARQITAELKNAPHLVDEILKKTDQLRAFARRISSWEDTFFIGRGLDYYVALEGSLKLKEISYIHAEAYAAGELKHGTLALITDGTPVIVLDTQPDLHEKTWSNMTETKARGAYVLAVVIKHPHGSYSGVDDTFELPSIHPLLAPLLTVVPLQLIAYYAAVERGCDVDKPRNLAKSVTVE